jgi:hypothetical protein
MHLTDEGIIQKLKIKLANVCSGPSFVSSRLSNVRVSMDHLDKLIKAIELRDANQVRRILDEHGELVHARDEAGVTALHYATFDGLREIAQLLLDRGAEINSRDSQFGATPTAGQSNICGTGAGILRLCCKTLLMPLSLEMPGG